MILYIVESYVFKNRRSQDYLEQIFVTKEAAEICQKRREGDGRFSKLSRVTSDDKYFINL